MDEEETQIETGDEGEETEGVDEELNNLKKDMAEHVVDKMGEKYNDILLYFGKGLIADYLVDEGGEDILNDFILEKLGVNVLSSYANQLKILRKQIKEANSKDEISKLEAKILEDLEKVDNTETQGGNSGGQRAHQIATTSATAAASSLSSTTTSSTNHVVSTSSSNENYTPEIEVSVDSARVGEAKEVPLKKRMEWLFPEGVPQTEKQMKKYLEKIKVPIRNPKGKEKTLKLYVHKKLANEYKAIFQEMFDKGIPVNPKSTACFNRRKMRKGKKMSHHSYGTALDVNWDVNGGVYGPTVKSSPYYNDQATVDIWKKHGFYWGGDWSSRSNDPMHFTYMNA